MTSAPHQPAAPTPAEGMALTRYTFDIMPNKWCLYHDAQALLRERDATIDQRDETVRRLNRRTQEAEKALVEYRKLIAMPPDGDGVRFVNGNLGRALLAWECEKQAERIDQLQRDLDEARGALRKCDEAMAWELGGEPLPSLMIEARTAISAALAGKERR